MTINVQSNGCCCVAKVALDRFYIIPVFDGDNSVLMAQIMKAHLRTTHLFDDPLEAVVDCSIGQNSAFRVGEDKVGFLPFRRGGFHEQLLLLLVIQQQLQQMYAPYPFVLFQELFELYGNLIQTLIF